jgi:thermitase
LDHMKKMQKLAGAFVAVAMMATLAPAASATMNANAPAAPSVQKVEKAKAYAQDRVLVKMKAGKDVNKLAEKHGAKLKEKLGDTQWSVVNVPNGKAEAMLEKLKGDADVEAVELDEVLTMQIDPNDPGWWSQWGPYQTYADWAWDITKGTASRTIAIVDTGVDLNHADLAGKFVPGYDFVNNDAVAQDDQGHGTHCAGIAAAIGNNGRDIAGMDWNAKIMPIKVLNSAGSGYTSNIINGVRWAADRGAHVISMSLGGGGYSQAFQDVINYAYGKGAIIVAAAGNSNTSAVSYPAGYSNVVSVASTAENGTRSSFSNYGSWVDVAAPGSNILSLRNGGGTTTMSGTSMATPLVAGLASLAWSKNTGYSNTTVINRIFNTTDKISGTGTYWVHGQVNAYKAVNGF